MQRLIKNKNTTDKLILIVSLMVATNVVSAPKQIKDQKEGDWRDGRYANVKFGPFVSGHIATPKGGTHKGIAIRIGEKGEGTMVFDTDLCAWRAGWTGDFLQTDPTRYGLIRALKHKGEILYSRSPMPGGARFFSFRDPRSPKHGPMPQDWMKYLGVLM